MGATWLRRLSRLLRGYDPAVDERTPRGVAPLPRPEELQRFEGMWVAVVDGQVVLAEHTSHKLALRLHEMDHRKRQKAVVEYVRPAGNAYIVGVG